MLKIPLLPRDGIHLLSSSESLENLGVEKVEKMTLEEDLNTKVTFCHAGVINITVLTFPLLFCKVLSELTKMGEMRI